MDESAGEKFGSLTYWLLAWGMLGPFWFLLGLTVFYFVLQTMAPQAMASVSLPLGAILAAADILALAGSLSTAYLAYSNYRVILEADHLTVKRGLLNIEESGVPYRRIKSVDLNQDMLDQLLGAATLSITVLGEVEEGPQGREEEIRLPYLPRPAAAAIQDALLSKAQVDTVNVAEGSLAQK